MYHTIEPEDSPRLLEEEKFYNVTPEKFEEQLKYLKDNGFGTVTIKQLIDSERDGELPPTPVMITFDDGHISHYQNAAPILKEYGFTAVFFIVVNDIGKKDRVMWDEVCGLFSDGMDIGSHGMSHKRLNESSYADL
jgi:peptidoglycan/xylan/chitin deacetylase (PgdA/CDA1 family)